MKRATVDKTRRRTKILERLNAYDSGLSEEDRRAVKASKLCTELLTEANRWPSTRNFSPICNK
jgi:hypothetical protein